MGFQLWSLWIIRNFIFLHKSSSLACQPAHTQWRTQESHPTGLKFIISVRVVVQERKGHNFRTFLPLLICGRLKIRFRELQKIIIFVKEGVILGFLQLENCPLWAKWTPCAESQLLSGKSLSLPASQERTLWALGLLSCIQVSLLAYAQISIY